VLALLCVAQRFGQNLTMSNFECWMCVLFTGGPN